MNLTSCENCGIVVDIKNIKLEPEYVDNEGNKIEHDYYSDADECFHNENLIWGENEYLDTWKCPVCKNFNGVEK